MSENLSDGYAICFNRWLFDDRIRAQLPLLLLISSLSAKEGYCYASNQYFAEKFKTSSVTVSKWISELKKYGYIETEDEKFGAVVTNRKIRIVDLAVKENFNGDYRPEETAVKENDNAVSENFNGGYRKVNPAVKENFNGYNMCNNTSHNITSQEYYKPLKSSSLSLANAREAKKQEVFKIPPFINPEIWKDFEAMRKQIRKPMSERAKKLIISKLQSLGEDKANEILEQSIVNCWQDVYPLKTGKNTDKEDEYADVPMFASDNPILKNNFLSRDMSVIYDRAAQIAIEDERLRSSPAQIEMKDRR
jgi:hypothetical protein|nr:MAG TPA: helix-turn-helix domain protein [Caudoviricetes sp.]